MKKNEREIVDRLAARAGAVFVPLGEQQAAGKDDVPENVAASEEEAAYQLGVRDGRHEALADVDRRTGGDGEYFYSTIRGRGCADADDMLAKIVGRFDALTAELRARGVTTNTAPVADERN